ncbi:restriction endonuclease subunit S [Pseudomonas sp. MWU12-2037]|uniref:restriction endonuclease subunit S n=1 Tax=Pseudomonas sp. MWU12-2037 TaxID=2928690 RepID=UPI00200EF6D9|nr:restriction endonuclease subunit S [Pseudomonas sp. MWU12-2037]
MELMPGYKQTEVGLIPEDWSTPCLGQLIHSVEYGSSAKSRPSGKIPVLRMGNLQDGSIDWRDLVFTNSEAEIKKYLLNPGDVLFNRTNTIDLVGKTAIYKGEYSAVFAGYLIRINENKLLLDSRFLNYVLNAEFSKKYSLKILSVAVGQANINGQKLKTYSIPLPPTLAEQKAIAEALSDADALIESLALLLTKKRQTKQGVMQELLTGQRRLPGFSGGWEKKTIGEVADVKTGPFGSSLHESDYVQSGTPIITVEHLGEFGVTYQNLPLVSEEDRVRLGNYSLSAGDIVFSRVGSVDRNALIREEQEGWLFSGRLLRVRPNHGVVYSPYLSFQFNTERFKSSVLKVAVGQTMASLNTQILKALYVDVPNIAEQTAIATILSDMDNDIINLESQLQKVRNLKQGLMQELLTGRIRLV